VKKLCIVATVDLPIKFFMLPHLRALQQYYELTVMLDTDNPEFLKEYGIHATVVPVPIQREISLLQDIRALMQLIGLFRSHRFHAIHSIAPKAGLLAMLAGFFTRVPLRLHCFTGQVWATSVGFRRSLLKFFDRLIAACATHVLTDSHSQQDFLVEEGIVSARKITVLAHGSVSGVDLGRFRPDAVTRSALRSRLDIPQNAVFCLYLGRMKRDKGVLDLAEAAVGVLAENRAAYLVFVGPDEEGLQSEIRSRLAACKEQLRFEEYTKTPEAFLAAADILCLPSYREGFGMVVLEAAATGIPALASRVYGVTDAVEDGVTGVLHAPREVDEIASKLAGLITDPERRTRLGTCARQRAEQKFAQRIVVEAMLEYYQKMEDEYEAQP
jgi:glycosyltransferase involved in cell wall biosynthesis